MTNSVAAIASIPGNAAAGQFLKVEFQMATAPGALAVPGLKVGDVMLTAVRLDQNIDYSGSSFFEAIVSVDDQLQQRVSNTPGGYQFSCLFYRNLG